MLEFRVMDKKLSIPSADLNLLKALQRHGVPFVIIGGHAVRFHGIDRDTEDFGVLVYATDRAKNIGTAMSETVGELPKIAVAEYGKPFKQIIVKRDGVNSDILTGSYGVEFAEVYQCAHVVEVDGLTLRVLSQQHLLRNKRAAKRGKDLSYVERLEALA